MRIAAWVAAAAVLLRRTLTAQLAHGAAALVVTGAEATKAGPGHYVISGAALGVEGAWTVEITARVSEFDEFRRKLQVPIR